MPATDSTDYLFQEGLGAYRYAAAVTPHDTNELTAVTDGIYIGTVTGVAGTLKVTTVGGNAVTFTGLLAGSTIKVAAKIIWATGTDATNIVALW